MYDYIHIKQPQDIDKINQAKLFELYFKNRINVEKFLEESSNKKYLYWDKTQYLSPIKGLTVTESWKLIRQIRKISSTLTPIRTPNGSYFAFYRPKYTDKILREIDMQAGGLFLTEQTTSKQEAERQKYLARGIVEESIASSQLEGADTSRRYAKKMLTENIKPRTKGEQMILNNYKVLQQIESKYKNEPLSIFMLQELQMQLVEKTLDPGYIPGSFRKDSDDIVVHYDQKIAHIPPKEAFVQKELQRLVKYANDTEFVHPIIKAIELHFWIGYLHPFPDGNGRLARAIFYWYLFKNGYWAMAYLPISTLLKRSPHDYTYSYIYAEQDELDFTYFFDYNVKKISESITQFKNHIEKKTQENTENLNKIKQNYPNLNNRQVHALHYLLRDKNSTTSAQSYRIMNAITLRTAYSDLKQLKNLGLVETSNEGRKVIYKASSSLKNEYTEISV